MAVEIDTLPRVFTVAQIQKALRISRYSAYQLCQSGRLQSFKVGASVRISEAALIEFMNSGSKLVQGQNSDEASS